jgi:hypothetical protein
MPNGLTLFNFSAIVYKIYRYIFTVLLAMKLQPPNQYTTTMHNIIITLPKELLHKAAIKAAEQQVSRKKFIETLIINQLTK